MNRPFLKSVRPWSFFHVISLSWPVGLIGFAVPLILALIIGGVIRHQGEALYPAESIIEVHDKATGLAETHVVKSQRTLERAVEELNLKQRWSMESVGEVVAEIRPHLEVGYHGNVVHIRYVHSDSRTAADVANGIANAYRITAIENTRTRLRRATSIITSEAEAQQGRVDVAREKRDEIAKAVSVGEPTYEGMLEMLKQCMQEVFHSELLLGELRTKNELAAQLSADDKAHVKSLEKEANLTLGHFQEIQKKYEVKIAELREHFDQLKAADKELVFQTGLLEMLRARVENARIEEILPLEPVTLHSAAEIRYQPQREGEGPVMAALRWGFMIGPLVAIGCMVFVYGRALSDVDDNNRD